MRKGSTARDGCVVIRRAGKDASSTGQLSLPAHMNRALPDGSTFRAEWHEDGILYRFLGINPEPETRTDPVPQWAVSLGGNDDAPAAPNAETNT